MRHRIRPGYHSADFRSPHPANRLGRMRSWGCLILTVTLAGSVGAESGPPPIPADVPVFLVGHPQIAASSLRPYRASRSMGRSGKDGPLGLGEKIEPRAIQEDVMEHSTEGGRKILRRSSSVTRPGSDQVLMRASIDMDAETLLPLRSRVEQGGATITTVYDWDRFVVRQTPGASGAEADETPLDIPMFEVGAHDVWMSALPLKEGFVGRLPVVMSATGTKYWAVPRVVGAEEIDLGDGVGRKAWVVELDWWGMGAANDASNYSPGGGVHGSGGPGGKYWVLADPPAGISRVVRVRTQVDAETDSVVQVQGNSD